MRIWSGVDANAQGALRRLAHFLNTTSFLDFVSSTDLENRVSERKKGCIKSIEATLSLTRPQLTRVIGHFLVIFALAIALNAGFMEQVGRNTDYIIHPEEILADNFALLVLNEHDMASPEILQKVRKVCCESRRP